MINDLATKSNTITLDMALKSDKVAHTSVISTKKSMTHGTIYQFLFNHSSHKN